MVDYFNGGLSHSILDTKSNSFCVEKCMDLSPHTSIQFGLNKNDLREFFLAEIHWTIWKADRVDFVFQDAVT